MIAVQTMARFSALSRTDFLDGAPFGGRKAQSSTGSFGCMAGRPGWNGDDFRKRNRICGELTPDGPPSLPASRRKWRLGRRRTGLSVTALPAEILRGRG